MVALLLAALADPPPIATQSGRALFYHFFPFFYRLSNRCAVFLDFNSSFICQLGPRRWFFCFSSVFGVFWRRRDRLLRSAACAILLWRAAQLSRLYRELERKWHDRWRQRYHTQADNRYFYIPVSYAFRKMIFFFRFWFSKALLS